MSNVSFPDALKAAKQGFRIARAGWNGKGMWVYKYDPPSTNDGPTNPFLILKAADNSRIPWVTSQADVLAEDWTVLPMDK